MLGISQNQAEMPAQVLPVGTGLALHAPLILGQEVVFYFCI
jgi:hypothetical protein